MICKNQHCFDDTCKGECMANRAKRLVFILLVSVFVVAVGAGCKNIKALELDFGGLDVEYFPSHPSQEEKSIFDFSKKTDGPPVVMPASYPNLMPLSR